MSLEENYEQMQLISKVIRLQLETGELDWADSRVQFFIPVVLNFTDFDWLELVAENNLVEEDAKIVKNFLKSVQTLMEVNAQLLDQSINDKVGKLFE